MKKRKSIDFNFGSRRMHYDGMLNIPDNCPLCKKPGGIDELFSTSFPANTGKHRLAVLHRCTRCYRVFVSLYDCSLNEWPPQYTFSTRHLYTAPETPNSHDFPDEIRNLSPQFIKIYNQALAAEFYGLDEIAGVGYRKSLEFLIKDYCVYLCPDKKDTILALPLSQCIANYIPDESIKLFASRTAWIGNDETHYQRKHEALGIKDMKDFISYTVSCIIIGFARDKARAIHSGN